MLRSEDADRVRLLTLDRPEALNAFNEALYDATAEALSSAAADPDVAVVVLTGTGRAFSAGTDVREMSARNDGAPVMGEHGFVGMVDQLVEFPKPLLCAVNGMAVGVGATMLALADLVIMAADARIRCPFTDLAVAPEAASSFLFPLLLGRQHATWTLLGSEWLSAEECKEMGLAWRVSQPDALLTDTMAVARRLATKSIGSLMESKRTIMAPLKEPIAAARRRESQAFSRLLGAPANLEALTALAERRPPDFLRIDAEHRCV
jgi:enoyl-CoA hydratase/carnithine racemase